MTIYADSRPPRGPKDAMPEATTIATVVAG